MKLAVNVNMKYAAPIAIKIYISFLNLDILLNHLLYLHRASLNLNPHPSPCLTSNPPAPNQDCLALPLENGLHTLVYCIPPHPE